MGTYIIIFGVFVLLILVLAFRTYPIEEIRDYRGKIVCVIYQKRINQFLVVDKVINQRINFSTFRDAEAYINRRLNRFEMHPELSGETVEY